MFPLRTGLDRLLIERPSWLTRGRVGLLAHPASISSTGQHAADLLAADPDINLCRLFGPEHGFFGWGGAGETILNEGHPILDLPVYSLYGEHRKPPREWIEDLDVLIVDLQDLGVRCYTYLSTLYLVMQAAEEAGVSVAVLDRPITAPGMVDGPLPEEAFKSFVAQVDVPLCHGMTPAEAAVWMQQYYTITLPSLYIVPMDAGLHVPGQERETPWISPSPGIRSWTTARVYPCTVFAEAFDDVYVERAGLRPFQLWGMEELKASTISNELEDMDLPGVSWSATVTRDNNGKALPAVGVQCTDVQAFKPVTAALYLLDAIGRLHGRDWLWERERNRPEFFDKLMGTDRVRNALQAGKLPEKIAEDCFVRTSQVSFWS